MQMAQESQADMSKFSVNIPDEVATDLQQWADEEGRPRENLAAFLLELAVRQKYPEKYPPERLARSTSATTAK